ncbi:MAG: stage III sporulation AC/AD family protein [Clostridia bacterium]|nr:stage III sporulation AC/AD family protein [Clostridia bacterium]
MNTLRFVGALFLTLVLLLILKELRVRYSMLFSASAAMFFVCLSMEEIADVLIWMKEVSSGDGFSSYFTVLLKSLGIALCTGFLAEFCRDLGEMTLSRAAELFGKGAILSLALPLLRDFLELVTEAIRHGA